MKIYTRTGDSGDTGLFGGGRVAKVEANFLGGPAPRAEVVGPSEALAAEKETFASTRRARWFGTSSP